MSKKENDGLTWFNSADSPPFNHVSVKFALPTKPTVRQQLAYQTGKFTMLEEGGYMQNFAGALAVMSGWECDIAPDPAAINIDTETNPAVTEIITFVAAQTFSHFSALENLEKN